MKLRKPEDFVREGSRVFRKAPVNKASIEGWIAISKGKVADAQRVANSPSTRLGAAYDSIFNLSLAVLCLHGWRCTAADGHHVQGIEAASGLCAMAQGLFDEIDALRDMRNNQYQGIQPSEADVAYALEVMHRALPPMLAHLAN